MSTVTIAIFLRRLIHSIFSKPSYDSKPYKYEPIKSKAGHIRVLTILPAQSKRIFHNNDEEDIIHCSLETVALTDKISFHALSYNWGPEGPGTVFISGRTVQVTPNLYAALKQLRSEYHSTYLWIDAICINQKNKDEKNLQVPMMKAIYKSASKVIVWLGPATSGENGVKNGASESDLVMDALGRIGQKALNAKILDIGSEMFKELFTPNPDTKRANIERELQQLSREVDFNFPFETRKALSERDYWRRVWIVQEFVIAKDLIIHCGQKSISYKNLAAGSLFLDLHSITLTKKLAALSQDAFLDPETGPDLTDKAMKFLQHAANPSLSFLVRIREDYQEKAIDKAGTLNISTPNGYTLFDLLARGCIVGLDFGQREVTDKRDIIYGLLGLATDEKGLNITPDYSDSNTVAKVYTSVTRLLLERHCTDILTWCQRNNPSSQSTTGPLNLPSWVPNLSSVIRQPCGETKKAALFKASGEEEFRWEPATCPTHLSITGIQIDRIKSLGPLWGADLTSPFDLAAAAEIFASIEDFCTESQSVCNESPKYQRPVSEEAKWRIPCADQQHDPYRGRIRTTLAVAAEGYKDVKKRIIEDHLQSEEGGRYQRAMGYLYNRRPALFEMGHVGLVPAHAKQDDLVCVILGVHVPFVLRKRQDGTWELIGEAFVYGIMDGEAVEAVYTTEKFVLS